MTPILPFDPQKCPAAPDYKDLRNWAMHPQKDSQSLEDSGPQVFWLHPTSLRSPLDWNETLGTEEASERFLWTREFQASAFTSCCSVFAPHYRQATLASYWVGEDGYKARELAYTDVLRAFDQFIAVENQGRPFILAGHSQGSEHGVRLLRDRILGTPLQERLIAAYMIGIPVSPAKLRETHPEIHVCQEPDDLHCLIAYSSFEKNTSSEDFLSRAVWYQDGGFHRVSGSFVCVNPVSWKTDGVLTSPDQHHGALFKKRSGVKFSAVCDNGIVRIDNVDEYMEWTLGGNYHLGDYSLFYYDIQENLQTRIAAYEALKRRP